MAQIDFARVLVGFLVLLISLTVHEAAHAWSADRLGDATARRLGRVSLNPAVHVDLIGTVVFPLMAMLTGLPLIGWAKPVPVNVLNLRDNWKQKFMVIAAAGPASNLALAVVAALVLRLMTGGSPSGAGPAIPVLLLAIQLNVLLAIFNMVPVPPLDGGNVLAGLLHGPVAEAYERLRPFGILIIYMLMLSGVLWSMLDPIGNRLLSFLL